MNKRIPKSNKSRTDDVDFGILFETEGKVRGQEWKAALN